MCEHERPSPRRMAAQEKRRWSAPSFVSKERFRVTLRFFEYVSPCGVDLPVRKRRFGSSWAPSQRRRPRTNGRSSTFSSAPVPYHLDATSCRVTRGSFEPISRYCAKRARTPAKRLISHVAAHCCRSARTILPVAPARCAHIPSSRSMPSLLQVLCLFGA